MKTLIIGVRPDNLGDRIVDLLGQNPGRELYFPPVHMLDVTNYGEVYDYVQEKGPFDEIVYSAGVNYLTWIKDLDMHDLSVAFEVNVFGFVNVVRAHLRNFEDHPMRVVAIVSDSSRTPMRGSLAYGSSKAALLAVVKNMARELAPLHVVLGVSPGIIEDTPMTDYIDTTVPEFRGWSAEQAANYERSMIPMQRRVTKTEVAKTVQFALEGPETLAGSIIEITGGK